MVWNCIRKLSPRDRNPLFEIYTAVIFHSFIMKFLTFVLVFHILMRKIRRILQINKRQLNFKPKQQKSKPINRGWLSCQAHAIGAGGLASIPGPVKSDTVSPTARHRCNVTLELCCPGAKPRRWAPPLVTSFGVIPRV